MGSACAFCTIETVVATNTMKATVGAAEESWEEMSALDAWNEEVLPLDSISVYRATGPPFEVKYSSPFLRHYFRN